MSKVNLNSLIENLDSKQIDQQIPAIEEATNILETLAIKAVESLKDSSNRFLVAERLSRFGSIIIPHLEKLLKQSNDSEVQILVSLVLLQLHSQVGVPVLLNAIKNDEEYAILAAQHLAKVEIKSAIEPICGQLRWLAVRDRLKNSKIEEIDLIVSLLDSLNKLDGKLPKELLIKFNRVNIPWQIKTKLEAHYLSAKL